LVAGDLPGLDQPALALSPVQGQDIYTGLLRLDDVLKLSLDADLVVLSACNTAAADGSGSEAVSGLGRGFFYAGSRSVLATHWPVETVSARQLVSHLFKSYAKDATLTRAQALQRAMLEVLDKDEDTDSNGKTINTYAHPVFWAPYALYGDPGR
jgi:CHAT domain-containing protein